MKSNVLKASLALLLAFTTLPISAQSEFYVSPEGKADGDGSAGIHSTIFRRLWKKPGRKRVKLSFICGKGSIFSTNRSFSLRRMGTTLGNYP